MSQRASGCTTLCRFIALSSTLLGDGLPHEEILQARQEMLGLAKVMVHLGDCKPDLLASALLKLATAYHNMNMNKQALAHCTDAVALAYRLHANPSASDDGQDSDGNDSMTVCIYLPPEQCSCFTLILT